MELAVLNHRRQMLSSLIMYEIKQRGTFLIYGDRLSSVFNADGDREHELESRVEEFAKENGWSVIVRDGGHVALFSPGRS